jgi:hypothetical protein
VRHSPDLGALGLGDGSIASDLAVANWCTGNPCFTCKIKARRRELFPVLSRMQNSGYDLGENNRSPELWNHLATSAGSFLKTPQPHAEAMEPHHRR